jgi:hypothetical protein
MDKTLIRYLHFGDFADIGVKPFISTEKTIWDLLKV